MTPAPEEQISTHLAALEAAPGDDSAFRALEDLYQKHDRWEDLVALYEGRARDGAGAGDGASGFLAKAAELAQRRVRNTARAEELWRQVLHADPRHPSALASMREIYEQRGDWPSFAEALERQADRTTDRGAAAVLYLELGRVYEERLGRPDRAALFYARAARLDPAHPGAREAALRSNIALRRFGQARRALDEARAEGADPVALAAEYARLGALLVDEPLDHGLAAEALAQALELDKAAPGATEALARLEAVRQGWRSEAQALVEEASRAKERRVASRLCLRAAALHALYDPGAVSRVVELAERALLLAPSSEAALDLLERWFAERQDWRGVERVLQRLSGALRDRVALAGIHLRLARIDLVQFGDAAQALEALSRALALDPASEPAAQQAFELHVEAGRPADALEVLEKHLGAAREGREHVAWRLRAAELAQGLGDEARARAHLEAALRADPRSPEVAAALAPLLERAGAWSRLASALETQLAAERDPGARARLLERLADVQASRLGAPREALRRLAQALVLDPGRAALRRAIDAAAAQADLFPELARAYRDAAASPAADARARKALLRRGAEVLDRDLGRPEQAIEAWRELVAQDPDDAGAHAALEACLVKAGRLEEIAEELRGRIASAEPAARRELLVKLGRVCEEAGDHAEAARAFREAVEAGEETAPVLRGLVAALEALGPSRAEERLDALSRLGAQLDGAARAAVELERAALLAGPLARPAEAAGVLLAALRAGALPANQLGEAVRRLEELLARGVEPIAIARALAPVYASQRDAAKQVAILEFLGRSLPQGTDPRERARLWLDAAAVRAERLGDRRGALSAASAAVRACPAHAEARRAAERLAREVGALPELYALFCEAAARLEGSPDDERALRAHAAQIAEEDLGNAEEASAQLRRALALAPGDPAVLAALTRVALGAERWEEAAELLADRVARTTGAERAALLAQLAGLLQERLGRAADAARTWREALAASGPDARPRLLARLASSLDAAGDAQGEAAALEELSRIAADPAEAAAAARRRARLQAERLGEPLAAVEHYRSALVARADDADARAALEALLGAEPAVARTAADALLAAAEAGGDPRKIIAALDAVAARAPDAAARAAAERRAAQIWGESLGQWSLAYAALLRAVRGSPRDAELRRGLRDTAARAGTDVECARAYEELLAAPPPDGLAPSLWRELARLREERLGDAAGATAAWTSALALAPGDAESLAALLRLHRAAGRRDEVVATALALADSAAPGGEADADLALELAELKRARLSQPAEALSLVAGVLRAEPSRAAARDALVALAAVPGPAGREALALCDALLRPLGEHAARALAREKRLLAVEDPAERAPLHAEIRAIYERDLGRPELAFASAARAFSEGGPAGADAAADLERLAAAAGVFEGLAQAYDAAAAAAPSASDARELRRRAARVREEHLGDPQAAIAAWTRVLDAAPDDAEALASLTRLYARAHEAAKLADVARRRAALAVGAERAAVLAELAELEEGVGDAGAAVAAAEEALTIDRSSARALALLARIFRQAGRAEDLARVLRAQAAAEHDDLAEREALLLERAELLEGVSDGRLALEAYAEVLAESPRQPRALDGLTRLLEKDAVQEAASRMLEDVFRAAGDARRLIALLDARLASADDAERVPLFAEIAVLHERLGDRAAAFRVRARQLAEAVRPGEDDPGLRAELERLAAAAGAWEPLAESYEALLSRGVPPAARTDVLRRLAGIHADQLGRPELAAPWLRELAHGGDAGALAALARVHRQAGAHRELADALRRQAEVVPEPERKKELLLEVARIMAENLSDREGAIDAYRHILSVDPEDPNALRLLGRLLGGAERWDELVDVLGREVAVAENKPNMAAEAAELRFRLGRIRQQRLSDVAGALQCYKGVLEKVPRHPAALAALEELARAGGHGAVEAATLLEPVYEEEGEHGKLLEVLEARAAAAPDAAARAAILRHMAEVQAGPMRSPEAGFLTAARALRDDPDDADSIALAARLADAAGLHEELAGLLAEVADRLRDPRARLELRRRIARLAAAGDARRASDAWARVLEVAPDDAEALEGLTAALRASGESDLLAHVLRRRIASAEDPAARVALLSELAEVQEQRQKDLAGAAATLRRLLELDPGRRDALAHLDRLCVELEKWVELADVIAREVAAADAAGDGAQARALRQRLGELKESRLLDKDGALALYEEVLAARPEDAQALGRVEAILAKDPGNARAAGALEKAYAASGAWERYAAVLDLRAGERPDPMERKALLLELAEVQEQRLRSPDLAFVALCRAFRDDPGDPALRRSLERLGEATGHVDELAALYEDEFKELPPSAAAETALVLGRLHEEKLGSPDEAVAWFEKARELDLAGASPALAALDRLYRRLGRDEELARVIAVEAEQVKGEERATFLFRLGQLAEEKLADPARAIGAYEALVAEDPRQVAALRALERLYEGGKHLDALARNLAAQRDLSTDAATRLRLTARLAATSQTLGRDEEAAALWAEALALDSRHEPALAALEHLYEKLERWPELAEHLRARLAVTADRRESARLHDKLGTLLGTRLGDAAEAVRAYLAVLDADPRNRKALEALRGLYAAQGDFEGLASVQRRLLPLQEDAAGVKAVRLELADVLLQAGRKSEAVEQGKRAFELEPHTPDELARLAALFEAAGAAQERVKAVEARASLFAAGGRAAEAIEAWLSAAEAWEKPLARPGNAAQALEKVLELEPERRDAWERLRAIYARAGSWRDYVRVCDAFTVHLEDRAEKVALLRELANIHEEKLGQKDMAFLTACRAFHAAGGDPAVAADAARLAAETQAFEELAAVYEEVADEAKGQARARLLIELGRLRDGKLDDADGAEAAFRRALELDPASSEALDALTGLFTRRGRVRDLVITLEQKLEAAAGLDEKKATLLEMARIYDGQLHDGAEAISALKRVLELDGADQAALGALADLYRREGRFGDLAGILARARDLAQDDAARLAYQLQVASLHENELADDEGAVEAYRAALGIDDTNREALSGLERLYTKLDRFAELNRIYERQAELAKDPRERVRILAKSASIWEEKLGNTAKAIERNEQVLALDGGNLASLKALEGLYRREARWEKLIAVLQHHATLTQDRREVVSLEVQMGEVWWSELGRADRAEAILTHALSVDPDSRDAVSALARLYEKGANWNLALEMLQREARLAATSQDAVDIQARIGRIQEERLQDRGAAKIAYARALDVDPGHVPSLRALRAIAEAERDREAYLRWLLAEARYAEDDGVKAKLLHEAGRIHQEERDDPDGAVRLYEDALKKVPDFLPAARPLADLYVARADWPRAEAVLDVVVKRLAQEGDAKELCRQSYRLGHVAEKLGDKQKALECQRRAYELDATYLPALEALGHLLVEENAAEEALRIYQAILIHHRDGLTDLEVVEIYWQIGDLQTRLSQLDRAAKSFEKALEIDGGHERSRRSLVAVLEAQGDYEAALEHRQRLVGQLTGAAKVEMYLAIGEICRDRLADPYQAIDAFTGAARLDPGHRQATEALLALYRETKQGQKAADVLSRLVETPEAKADPQRAAKLHHALALTLRDELADEEGAARAFEAALDADPRFVQAFADLEALLTKGKRWRELESAYLRMVQRLPKGPESSAARVALWKTLGELYRRALEDPDKARMAYEVVARTDPHDVAAVEAHAELAGRVPGHEGEAIAAWRQLMRSGGSAQKATSALVALHAQQKQYDLAYSAAQALAFLVGGATQEEGQVVSRLRRFARDTASGALDDVAWVDRLLHERARGPLAAILALLTKHASDVFVQAPKDLGLNPKKDEVDVQGSMLFFVNMYKYVARALGLAAPPRLFRSAQEGARLHAVALSPPALVAGEELFRERPKKELWFVIGKAMAFLRPELLLARLMPHDQLDALFQAAASLGTSRFVVTADPHLVQKLKHRLEKSLPDETRTQTLKKLARAYCDVQHPGDVRAYMDAAELTSNRVGALLAGDLDVVRRMVVAEKAAVSKLKEERRLQDLVLFCTSEDYAALRAQLGLSVVVPS